MPSASISTSKPRDSRSTAISSRISGSSSMTSARRFSLFTATSLQLRDLRQQFVDRERLLNEPRGGVIGRDATVAVAGAEDNRQRRMIGSESKTQLCAVDVG